ncbi:TOBE domain-containing protein [Klenkia taihuensis]
MNLCTAELRGDRVALGELTVPVGHADVAGNDSRGEITVGIRPEALTVTTAQTGLRMTVRLVEELGADAFLYGTATIAGKDQALVVRTDGRRVPDKGDAVGLDVDPTQLHLFAARSGERLTGPR